MQSIWTFLVPNRFDFGYGLSPEIVQLAQTKSPDLIVTVDNGVASIAGVATANAAGIDVIITDHHLPGEKLPAALALVNPNLNDSAFSEQIYGRRGCGLLRAELGAARVSAGIGFNRRSARNPI